MTLGTAMDDSTSLGDARDWLRSRVENGAICPCCKQFAKVYRRKMTSVTGRTMIAMNRFHGQDWVHIPTLMKNKLPDVAHQGGYATLGQHWGLMEESLEERSDGGKVGWWRITNRGELFIHELITVPKYARLYDGRRLGTHGVLVSIQDVLGSKFDLGDLMRGD